MLRVGGECARRRLLARHVRSFGALTAKPYAFNARPWELRKTDTVDVMDGMGASVQVHTKQGEVVRVQPRENDEINEEWIHDKTRYAYDGLKRQRLTRPLVRGENSWDETHSTWRGAFQHIAHAVKNSKAKNGGTPKVRAIVGASVELNSTVALADWVESIADTTVESLGSNGGIFGADVESLFRFNSGVLGLEESDFCLLVGTHVTHEAPLLQLRLRKMFLRDQTEVCSLGMPLDLTFPIAQAGLTAKSLIDIAKGNHPICEKLKSAKKPAILVGAQVYEREDGATLAAAIETIAENSGNLRQYDEATGELSWNGVNVVHNSANDCGHLELARTKPFESNQPPADILYLLGVSASELPVPIEELVGENTFVVTQAHHGDALTSRADVVLPGGAFTEKSGVYVNFEGRPQKARNAITPPVDAREDWKIIRALSEVVDGPTLPFDSESDVQDRLVSLLPSLNHRNKVSKASAPSDLVGKEFAKYCKSQVDKGTVNNTPFRPQVYDFYLDGSVIAESSATMAKSSRQLNKRSNFIEMEY
mmetsp:Transcript_10085/g.17736  ORF Transcript_10085/g.17736 Transcript_10085/m.17736 type:complete len:537 (+) Transcript_10085:125-1735(+)